MREKHEIDKKNKEKLQIGKWAHILACSGVAFTINILLQDSCEKPLDSYPNGSELAARKTIHPIAADKQRVKKLLTENNFHSLKQIIQDLDETLS